jgi:hypothetical protein
MSKKRVILLMSLAISITACAPQQQLTPHLSSPTYASPVPYTSSGDSAVTPIQPNTPQILSSYTSTPFADNTPFALPTTKVYDTPTFSPTLTPIATLKSSQAVPLVHIHMMDNSRGWGIEEKGHIVHTNDGATTWNDATPPQGAYNENGFFALDSQTAWATPYCLGHNYGAGNLYYCEEINQTTIWTTHNGGNTWLASPPICLNSGCDDPISSGDGSLLPESIRFIDSQHGWLVISTGSSMYQDRYNIFYSDHSGNSWIFLTSASTGTISASITALEPIDKINAYLFYNNTHGAWAEIGNDLLYSQSNDGGNNWNEDIFSLPASPIPDPNWEDLNCGTIDSKTIPPLVLDLSQECFSPNKTNSVTSHYFIHLHSENSGNTWNSWQQTGDVDFINGKSGWQMVSRSGNIHEIQQTHDGGLTWSVIKTVEWDGTLNFINEQIGYALAYDKGVMAVVHTTDGGQTWELKSQATLTGVPCLISTWDLCDR